MTDSADATQDNPAGQEEGSQDYRWGPGEYLRQGRELGSAMLNHTSDVVNNYVRPAVVNWNWNQTNHVNVTPTSNLTPPSDESSNTCCILAFLFTTAMAVVLCIGCANDWKFGDVSSADNPVSDEAGKAVTGKEDKQGKVEKKANSASES